MKAGTLGKSVVGVVALGFAAAALGQVVMRPAQPTAPVNANLPGAVKNTDMAVVSRFVAMEARIKALESTVAAQAATITKLTARTDDNSTKVAQHSLAVKQHDATLLKMKTTFNGHKHFIEGTSYLPLHLLYVTSNGRVRTSDDPDGTKNKLMTAGTDVRASIPIQSME